jgi:hypothetical protein
MSKDKLEPGDIIKEPDIGLGMVMRNDEDSGLLLAFPGMDELITGTGQDGGQAIGNIKDIERKT